MSMIHRTAARAPLILAIAAGFLANAAEFLAVTAGFLAIAPGFLAIAPGFPALAAQASPPRFAPVFGDHMVLQRDVRAPVWGTADPGARVEVAFAGKRAQAQADSHGRWIAWLPPLRASEHGAILKVRDLQGAGQKLIDVLVGDVWLCSGQSNMRWTVANSEGAAGMMASANIPGLRLLHMHDHARQPVGLDPAQYFNGAWACASPEQVRDFSAIALSFGRELCRHSRVPVALILNAVGGAPMISWLPDATVSARPEYAVLEGDPPFATPALRGWVQMAIQRDSKAAEAVTPGERLSHPYQPSYLYHAGIEPLLPMALMGVIWYQGESDAEHEDPALPERLLCDLVQSWREGFKSPQLPFLMVQLPRIDSPERKHWPIFREVQRRMARELPGVYTAVTIDLKVFGANVHPPEKIPVGERLALIARARIYGEDVAAFGPDLAAVRREGNTVRLHFDYAEGLHAADGGALRGFELAGKDGRFHAAAAEIDGKTIRVTCELASLPEEVRYGWQMNPDLNLVNSAGLPASPFRAACPGHVKLFILTGQSNSLGTTNAGESDPSPGDDPADSRILFYWHNRADSARSLGSSGGRFTSLIPQQGGFYPGSPAHWGPEINFGRTLYRAGLRDFGIIKCSRGGGGSSCWSRDSADHHMYTHVVETVTAACSVLTAAGHTFEIAGLAYLQGESDTADEAAAAGTRFKALVDNLRADLPNAAEMFGVIGGIAAAGAVRDTVRLHQQAAGESCSYIDYFGNLDLQSWTAPDNLHFNKAAKLRIGERFAQAFFQAGVISRRYGPLVFIGDSITQGGNGDHPGYRYTVFRNLAIQGVPNDSANGYKFAGSVTGPFLHSTVTTPDINSQAFENVHEGHFGWRTAWISGRIALPAGRYGINNLGTGTLLNWTGQSTTYATADSATLPYAGAVYTPETAVILIGINDIADGVTPFQVRNDIGTLIDQLRGANPDVRIFLNKTLHTDQGAARDALVNELHRLLPALVAARNGVSSTSPVWLVDPDRGFEPSTMTYDHVHPNAAGEAFIGDRIAAAMGIIESPMPAP